MWRTVQNKSWVQDYIRQRMSERGFEDYHFEIFELKTNTSDGYYQIEASNQYYYPIAMDTEPGVVISSDLAIQQVEDKLYLKPTEHTGNIQVMLADHSTEQIIQFIRVIPK